MQTLAAQRRVKLGRTGQGRVHWAWVVQFLAKNQPVQTKNEWINDKWLGILLQRGNVALLTSRVPEHPLPVVDGDIDDDDPSQNASQR